MLAESVAETRNATDAPKAAPESRGAICRAAIDAPGPTKVGVTGAGMVGWPAVTGDFSLPPLLLWFGSIAWVVGYDTLYAIQDKEDDALVGVKSSARRLGDKARLGIAACYLLAVLLWSAAIWAIRPDWIALAALAPAALHLAAQALRADPDDGELALKLFRSNRTCGLLVFLGMLAVGLSSH